MSYLPGYDEIFNSKRKVNMEKKDERQIIETTIREAQDVIDKAKKSLAELEVTYSIGDRFINERGEKRILVAVDNSDCNRVMFSKLDTGHGDGFKVGNWSRILPDELKLKNYTRYWDSQKKINTGE